jgi:hypothetical protein
MTEQAGTHFTLDDIKRRVAKLRALAERAGTEGERDVALEKAAHLMEQHAIEEFTLAQDPDASVRVEPVVQYISFGRNQPYIKARRSMLASVCDDNRVRIYMMSGRDRLCLIGFQSDIDYSLELYASLELHMRSMMDLAEVRRGTGGSLSSFRTNFAYGYASRIHQRLAEWRRARAQAATSEPGTALVLRDRGAIVTAKVTQTFGATRTRKGPPARHQHDGGARAAGAMAANDADLSGGRKSLEG